MGRILLPYVQSVSCVIPLIPIQNDPMKGISKIITVDDIEIWKEGLRNMKSVDPP